MMPLETSGSTPLSPESNLDQRLTVSHPVIDAWLRAVNAHSVDAVCSLYAPEAILLPTLSDVIRDTPDRIRDYFESFLNRKNLSATLRNCYVQEYSEIWNWAKKSHRRKNPPVASCRKEKNLLPSLSVRLALRPSELRARAVASSLRSRDRPNGRTGSMPDRRRVPHRFPT